MTESARHPLLAYPEAERVAYLSIIAELSYVDGKFDDKEKSISTASLKLLRFPAKEKSRSIKPSLAYKKSIGLWLCRHYMIFITAICVLL